MYLTQAFLPIIMKIIILMYFLSVYLRISYHPQNCLLEVDAAPGMIRVREDLFHCRPKSCFKIRKHFLDGRRLKKDSRFDIIVIFISVKLNYHQKLVQEAPQCCDVVFFAPSAHKDLALRHLHNVAILGLKKCVYLSLEIKLN